MATRPKPAALAGPVQSARTHLPTALVRLAGILRPLQLHLQPLGPNLKPIHGLDSTLGREGVVETDKSEALAEVGVLVDEHFGADDVAERLEHLNEVRVLDIVGKVVDEEVAALRTYLCGAGREREGGCGCVRVCVHACMR